MKKNLVVIGGGFAGSCVAKSLEKKFDVTLVDTKEYFEFTPGILRTIVQPEHIKKIEVIHTHYLSRTRVIVGQVSEVSKEFIKVNNKKIQFDYLVICSGSSYHAPIKAQELIIATRARNLRDAYD